jgi:hypothetical protein
MTDQFEQRLSLDLRTLAEGGVRPVDRRAIAENAIAHGRRRGIASLRGVRLALVAALLGAVLFGALFAAGMKTDDPFDATSERILVWLPSGGDSGAAYLFDPAGTPRWSGTKFSDGCPTLLPGSGVVLHGSGSPRGTGGLRIETDDGRAVEEIDVAPGTSQYWAPDRSAVALISFETGLITVVRFGQGTTQYGQDGSLAFALTAAVLNGGSRVVVAVRTATGVDLHLLDGRDTVIHQIEPFDAQVVDAALLLAPDGSRVAVVWANTEGRFPEPHVVVVSLPDGTAVSTRPEVVSSPGYVPLSWSPDSSTLALLYGGGVQLYDAVSGAWRDSGWKGSSVTNASRWRNEPGAGLGIAMFDGDRLDVYRERAATPKRVVIAGGIAAFSPDGRQFAFLEGAGPEEVGSGRPTRIWAVDVWGEAPNRLIATLPLDRPPFISEPCIDWQSGGTP